MPRQMVDPSLLRRIESMVGAALPTGTVWGWCDRTVPTPMNLVLDIVEDRLGEPVVMAWVDEGGSPDLFTLSRLPVPVAVWSSRFLELCASLRTLLVDAALNGQRGDLARRMFLRILAERAIGSGRPDLAAKAMVGAEVDVRFRLPTENLLDDLEAAPVSEAYVALWFFGLVHEFGHRRDEADFAAGPLTDESINLHLRHALARTSVAQAGVLDPAASLVSARTQPRHPLHPTHVRGEAQADLFAAEVLVEATPILMARALRVPMSPLTFIAEMQLATALIGALERCKGFFNLMAVSPPTVDPQQYLMAPAAMAIRQLLLVDYLTAVLGPDAVINPTLSTLWHTAVNMIGATHSGSIADMESGLAAAFSFMLDDHVSIPDMIDTLRMQSRGIGGPLLQFENRTFTRLAERHRGRSPNLDALLSVLTDDHN